VLANNTFIIVPFATWAVAQILKFAIHAFRGDVDFRYLYASGGMPSVHSAVVCSLATTALLVAGPGSQMFGFTAIFAAIVMYDSFGVRRSAGETAVAFNMLMESLEQGRVRLERPGMRLREMLGHQPKEVLAGAVLGIVFGLLLNYQKLGSFGQFLEGVPRHPQWYLIGFVVTIIAGWVVRFVLAAKYPKSKIMRRVRRRILALTQTVGWLGIVSAAFMYENASYLAWRLWALVIIGVGVFWAVGLIMHYWKLLPETLALEANEQRKLKWLNWHRPRKKSKK
jgi:hypothetical protein